MKKKLIRVGLGFILLLLVVGGSAFWYISRSGSGRLEQWIQSQLLTIANSYLNPKLSIGMVCAPSRIIKIPAMPHGKIPLVIKNDDE